MHPRLLLVATQLLTRLPVGDPVVDSDDVPASVAWFGVVGGLVGGLVAFVWWSASIALPRTAAATAALLATALLTGALHEDGLADTADGLFGAETPQRRLEIMRDAAVGAYGVLALVLTVILRVALLASLSPLAGATALVVTATLSRGLMAVALIGTVPARPGGAGWRLLDGLPTSRAVVAGVSGVVVTAVLVGLATIGAVLAAGAAMLVVRAIAVRRLGGLTGDVMGAMVVLAEVATLALLVGLDVGPALGG